MKAESWQPSMFIRIQDVESITKEIALESIRNAIALDTTSSYLYYTHARIDYFLKKYNDAQVSAEKAISLAPAWTRPYALLGNIHYRKKNDSLSTYYFREAVKRKPTVYDYVNLAGQYFGYSWKNIGYPYMGSKLDSAALLFERRRTIKSLNEKLNIRFGTRFTDPKYTGRQNREDPTVALL